jgi:diguanylate cyclase (GGDEF)-like protein
LNKADSSTSGKLLDKREIIGWHKTNTEIHLALSVTPSSRNKKLRLTGLLRDVTAQKSLEQGLVNRANHDQLTGLPNRALFYERLNHSLKLAKRSYMQVGLFFVDLDKFKFINDTYGHATGDMLLQVVAEKLEEAVRDSDTVCRLGGDEFTIILEGLEDKSTPTVVANRIMASFKEPLMLGEHEVDMKLSIGIAISKTTRTDADELVSQANEAVYAAKENGAAQYRCFTTELHAKNLYRRELLKSIDLAIEKKDLKVFYQPQLSIDSESLLGAKALMRWVSDKYGSVEALDQSKQDTQGRNPICQYIGQVTTRPKFSRIL